MKVDKRVLHLKKNLVEDFFQQVSAIGSYPIFILIAITFMLIGELESAWFILVGTVLLYIFAVPIRLYFFKNRPKPIAYKNLLEKVRASSILSLHGARISFLFLFMIEYFNYHFEHIMFLLAISLLVIYSRIYRRRHKPIETLIGVILGTSVYFIMVFL